MSNTKPDATDPELVARYATVLIELVRHDYGWTGPDNGTGWPAHGEIVLGHVRSWEQFHRLVDANGYLEDADRAVGVVDPFCGPDYDVDLDELTAYVEFVNAAIAIAETELWVA